MKNSIENKTSDKVVLSPIFGIRPGIYISLILAIVGLIFIFFTMFYPGIKNGGRYYSFTSPSGPVAVFIDGTYTGGTPFEVFLPSGDHVVEYERNGIPLSSENLHTDHPVFLTWLFPRRSVHSVPIRTFSSAEMSTLHSRFLSDLAKQSLIMDFPATSPYMPVFIPWAKDVLAFQAEKDYQEINQIFLLGSAHITGKELLEDATAAYKLFEDHGLEMNSSFLELAEKMIAGQLLPEREAFIFSPVPSGSDALETEFFSIEGIVYPDMPAVVGDSVYQSWPDIMQNAVHTNVSSFTLAQTPVTEYQWSLFIQENPYWASSNKAQLITDGMVDDNYLAGIYPSVSRPSHRPIRNISHHAAQAFVGWLSSLSGRRVFLPTEAQWEAAAHNTDSFTSTLPSYDAPSYNGTAPQDMLGGVWEMTGTSFIPLARLKEYDTLHALSDSWPDSGAVVLKGGSYVSSNEISLYTVGISSREECAEYTGFRVAWE